MRRMLILLLVLLANVSALGQTSRLKSGESVTSIGFGTIIRKEPYKGYDVHAYPVPVIFYQSNKFFFRELTAGYHLYNDRCFRVNAIVSGRLDGYDDDDSDALEGMDDRKHTVDAGIEAFYRDGFGTTKLSLVGDITNEHQGYEAELTYSKRFNNGRFSIVPTIGAAYLSQNLTDYYYGVRNDEARAGRPAYEVDGEFSFLSRLRLLYQLSQKWQFYSFAGYQWFGSEVNDSPIVSRDYQVTAGLGFMYEF